MRAAPGGRGNALEVRGAHRRFGPVVALAGIDWDTTLLPDDESVTLGETDALTGSARGLEKAVAALREQGTEPFLEPHRFDDAGWIANRWCEILPISLAAKQKLMELPDPLVRLRLVDDYLRSKGVVS